MKTVSPKRPHAKNISFNKTRQPQRKRKTISLIDERCDWNGTVFPFRGTKDLQDDEDQDVKSDYDDDEWSATTSNCSIKVNNSLGALIGAYMSNDDSEEEVHEATTNFVKPASNRVSCDTKEIKNPTAVQHETHVTCELSDNDSLPTEVRIIKDEQPIDSEHSSSAIVESNKVRVPKSNKKRKRTRIRQKTIKKNLNDRSNNPIAINPKHGKNHNDFPYKFRRRKVTLLEKLLENEIIHERNVLLQCVKYVVLNNFFDTVNS